MPFLAVNASAVEVATHRMTYTPLPGVAAVVRNFRGTCVTALVTARGYVRVWDFTTPPMTHAVAASFEADITTGDLFTLTGDAVTATCTAALHITGRDDTGAFRSFTFTAEESP